MQPGVRADCAASTLMGPKGACTRYARIHGPTGTSQSAADRRHPDTADSVSFFLLPSVTDRHVRDMSCHNSASERCDTRAQLCVKYYKLVEEKTTTSTWCTGRDAKQRSSSQQIQFVFFPPSLSLSSLTHTRLTSNARTAPHRAAPHRTAHQHRRTHAAAWLPPTYAELQDIGVVGPGQYEGDEEHRHPVQDSLAALLHATRSRGSHRLAAREPIIPPPCARSRVISRLLRRSAPDRPCARRAHECEFACPCL